MELIKRLKAPTPKKYKVWGKFFKWISGSLIAGILAVNSVGMVIPTEMNTILASIIFVTTSISTAFYAQVEDKEKKDAKN